MTATKAEGPAIWERRFEGLARVTEFDLLRSGLEGTRGGLLALREALESAVKGGEASKPGGVHDARPSAKIERLEVFAELIENTKSTLPMQPAGGPPPSGSVPQSGKLPELAELECSS